MISRAKSADIMAFEKNSIVLTIPTDKIKTVTSSSMRLIPDNFRCENIFTKFIITEIFCIIDYWLSRSLSRQIPLNSAIFLKTAEKQRRSGFCLASRVEASLFPNLLLLLFTTLTAIFLLSSNKKLKIIDKNSFWIDDINIKGPQCGIMVFI